MFDVFWIFSGVVVLGGFFWPQVSIVCVCVCVCMCVRSLAFLVYLQESFGYIRPLSGALDGEMQHIVFCTEFLDG